MITGYVEKARKYEELYNKDPNNLFKFDGSSPKNGNDLKNFFLNKAQDTFVKAAKVWKAENITR